MLELFIVASVVTFGVLALVGLALAVIVMKVLVWLLLLPVRLVFWLVLLPFLLLKGLVGLLFGAAFAIVLVPLAFVALALGVFGIAATLALPSLLVLAVVFFGLWLCRSPARPVPAIR